jgi:hypothetical protein
VVGAPFEVVLGCVLLAAWMGPVFESETVLDFLMGMMRGCSSGLRDGLLPGLRSVDRRFCRAGFGAL